jgi:hypothetical protein
MRGTGNTFSMAVDRACRAGHRAGGIAMTIRCVPDRGMSEAGTSRRTATRAGRPSERCGRTRQRGVLGLRRALPARCRQPAGPRSSLPARQSASVTAWSLLLRTLSKIGPGSGCYGLGAYHSPPSRGKARRVERPPPHLPSCACGDPMPRAATSPPLTARVPGVPAEVLER